MALTSVLEMTLNGLIRSEHSSTQNKRNGYRKAFAIGMEKQIELKISKDGLGLFQPMVLDLIRDQKTTIRRFIFLFSITPRMIIFVMY